MGCYTRVGLSYSASIPSGAPPHALVFDRVDAATTGAFKSISPSKLFATAAGLYKIVGHLRWLTQSGGRRYLCLVKNTSLYLCIHAVPAPPPCGPEGRCQEIATLVRLAAGDWVELGAWQDSGADVGVGGGVNDTPIFGLVQIQAGSSTVGGVVARSFNSLPVPHNTWMPIPFDAVEHATAGVRNSSYPTRLIAPSSGTYAVVGHVNYYWQPGGIRELSLRVNGVNYVERYNEPSAGVDPSRGHYLQAQALLRLGAGDYVELVTYQDSGLDAFLYGGVCYGPRFSMAKVA